MRRKALLRVGLDQALGFRGASLLAIDVEPHRFVFADDSGDMGPFGADLLLGSGSINFAAGPTPLSVGGPKRGWRIFFGYMTCERCRKVAMGAQPPGIPIKVSGSSVLEKSIPLYAKIRCLLQASLGHNF